MKTRIISASVILLALFLMGPTTICFSQPPLTAKELLDSPRVKDQLGKLENGEIVMLKGSEREQKNELSVIMSLLAKAPLDRTVAILQQQATAEDGPGILAIGQIKDATGTGLDSAIAKLSFAGDEMDEVKRMMNITPGGDFNFSKEEISSIQKRAKAVKDGEKSEAAVKAMSAAMRDVIKGRYLSYRNRGLDALAPYQVDSSKQVYPSKEMITATESLLLVKERFPEYYANLRYYPEKASPKFTNQFFWVKQTESKRPIFVLKHWVLDVQPDFALIAERRFYLNHSLNSLQVVIGCFPHGDRTLVVLLNQAFTEKVNMAIGRSIAKQVGYMQVEKNIRPIFENLRAAIGNK